MVRITIDTFSAQIKHAQNKKVYEKIFTCPKCEKKYETSYGLRNKCVDCGLKFVDVFSLLEHQWKRTLWHTDADEFRVDYYSTDSKKWEKQFNGEDAV